MSSCRICAHWDFLSAIGVDKFIHYQRVSNISDLFRRVDQCPKFCSRICCDWDIQELLNETWSPEYLANLVTRVYDLTVYSPKIYAKGIVAEYLLGGSLLREQFLSDATFDQVLNQQKYEYLASLGEKRSYSQEKSYQKLQDQVSHDLYSMRFREIFGNHFQLLIFGLMDADALVKIYHQFPSNRMKNQILGYLPVEFLQQLESNSIIDLVINAKSSLEFKISKFWMTTSLAERLALVHNLDMETSRELFLEVEDCIDPDHIIPVKLKCLENITCYDVMISLLETETEPIIQAAIYYQLSRLAPDYDDFLRAFSRPLEMIQANSNLFIPLVGADQIYYHILLNNPAHPLADYYLNLIIDRSLLQKLQFHRELRFKIKQRYAYSNHDLWS